MATQKIANGSVHPLQFGQRVKLDSMGEGTLVAHAFAPDKYGDVRMVYLIKLDHGRRVEGEDPGRAFISTIVADPGNVKPVGEIKRWGPLEWVEPSEAGVDEH